MLVYVRPDELWDYFQKEKFRLENFVDLVAEIEPDTENEGLQVFITERNGFPELSVEFENESLETKCALSRNECSEIGKGFYKLVETFEPEDWGLGYINSDETENDIELVKERESDMLNALKTFLEVASDSITVDLSADELTEILDEMEMMLFEKFGFLFYRPVITNEDGEPQIQEFWEGA